MYQPFAIADKAIHVFGFNLYYVWVGGPSRMPKILLKSLSHDFFFAFERNIKWTMKKALWDISTHKKIPLHGSQIKAKTVLPCMELQMMKPKDEDKKKWNKAFLLVYSNMAKKN